MMSVRWLWTAVVTACALSAGLASAQDQVPDEGPGVPSLEQLFAPPANRGVSVSPSGRFVGHVERIVAEAEAEAGDEVARYQFVITDVSSPENPARQVAFGDVEPSWISWVSDDRIIASVNSTIYRYGMPYGGTDDGERVLLPINVGRLLSIPIDNAAESVVLFYSGPGARYFSPYQTFSNVVDVLPDDPDHILVAAWRRDDYSLWKVDLNTGEPEIEAVGSSHTFAWYTNVEGEPVLRFDQSSAGDEVIVRARGGRRRNWLQIERYRLDELDDAPAEFAFAGRSQDPDQVYVLARPEGADRLGIYLYTLSNLEYGELVGGEDDVDVATPLQWGRDGAYVGYVAWGDRLRVRFSDPRFGSAYEAARQLTPADRELIPVEANGETFMFVAVGPTEPGEFLAFGMDSGTLTPIAQSRPDLSAAQLADVSPVHYAARDGTRLQAYLTEPAAGASSDTPLIIMPHGGPTSRDTYGFDPVAQFYASLGYAVLQPNFRGSSGFGAAFAEAGNGEWGGVMQDDLTDSVNWMVAQGLADADQVCIVGWSYGGYAALMGALTTPDLYQCAIAGAAVTDLPAQIEHWEEVFEGSQYIRDAVHRLYGDPRSNAQDLAENSPVNRIAELSIPVLLQHGRRDSRVPVKQAQDLVAVAEPAGVPLSYFEYETEGHSFNREGGSMTLMLGRTAAFLAEHLPSTANPPDRWADLDEGGNDPEEGEAVESVED